MSLYLFWIFVESNYYKDKMNCVRWVCVYVRVFFNNFESLHAKHFNKIIFLFSFFFRSSLFFDGVYVLRKLYRTPDYICELSECMRGYRALLSDFRFGYTYSPHTHTHAHSRSLSHTYSQRNAITSTHNRMRHFIVDFVLAASFRFVFRLLSCLLSLVALLLCR